MRTGTHQGNSAGKFPGDRPRREGFVEEQINEAMARGEFAEVEGKGRPLALRGDLSDRATMRQKLRSNAGFEPPWNEVGREIETLEQRALVRLRLALEFREAGRRSPLADPVKIEGDFRAHLGEVELLLKEVNSLVLKHNLLLPRELGRLHRRRLTLAALWERLGAPPESH